MKFIADFHIHSKYSRATSPRMELENLDRHAKIKGLNVLGTGDFTHPLWFKHLKDNLEPAEKGFFKLKKSDSGVKFMLSAEISCIYSKNGKVRKIHNVIFAPSFEAVEKINARLGLIGNLNADGRPILGLDAKELARIVFDASERCMLVPAHVMTPWFSLFGSKSGFDSLEECFEDYSKYIYALETGLSADPPMLWKIPAGRKLALISNSDSHSPEKIAREANVFDCELSYDGIFDAIKSKDKNKFLCTIEFFPQEGKYHYDGHRNCNVSSSPSESKKYNNVCPNCGRPLTIGVLNRIEELALKAGEFSKEDMVPFKSLVPLKEIVAESLALTLSAGRVEQEYNKLIDNFGNELRILLDVDYGELQSFGLPEIAEGVKRVREGNLHIEPGYDGVYGKVRIFKKGEDKIPVKQTTLF